MGDKMTKQKEIREHIATKILGFHVGDPLDSYGLTRDYPQPEWCEPVRCKKYKSDCGYCITDIILSYQHSEMVVIQAERGLPDFLPCRHCGGLILPNKQRCPYCEIVDPLNRGIAEPKPDENLLYEISDILHRHYYPTVHESIADSTLEEAARQVIVKVSSIKDAECQERVERIIREIERRIEGLTKKQAKKIIESIKDGFQKSVKPTWIEWEKDSVRRTNGQD
jgi:hypothetical protein